MKKFSKLITVLMAILFCFSLVACGRKGHSGDWDVEIDEHKRQLYVSNFNGGYGDGWLRAAATRFEEQNKNRTFSDGKVGVQIIAENAKITGPNLMGTVLSSRNHVFLTEGVVYKDYVSQGIMLDISDIVTAPLTAYGETKSISDKMTQEQRDSLVIGGKYYAIPHYAGYNGITVNVDLMDEQNLFMSSTGQFNKMSTSTGLSNGPDGVSGTYDDGLPSTYDEFYALCTNMKKRGITPMSWSGQYQWYVTHTLAAMCVDDMGLEASKLQFTFNDGSCSVINTISDNGSYTTENKNITLANGYEVFKQPGFYNSLAFIKKIVGEKWYTDESFASSQSHTQAQDSFLASGKVNRATQIGMLVEGCWWESEATGTFNSMEKKYKEAGKKDRKFRFIPFPKSSSAKVGEGATLVEANQAYGFIRSNIETTDGAEMKNLAKDFLQFINTDVSLVEFSVNTDTVKALDYTVADADLAKMSYFGRSLLQLKNDPKTKILYPPLTNIYSNNYIDLQFMNRLKYNNYSDPTDAFVNNPTLTAKAYFNGMASKWEEKWETVLAKANS